MIRKIGYLSVALVFVFMASACGKKGDLKPPASAQASEKHVIVKR